MASYSNQYQTNLKLSDPVLEPEAYGTHVQSYLNPPPRYHDYVAAQQRVANWVEQARTYQTSDSMTAASQNSEMMARSRTRRPSSSASGNGGRTGNVDQNDIGLGGGTGTLAGSYPSPPPSKRPHSSSRSRTRASSNGTQRRKRRARDNDSEVPPLPVGPIPRRTSAHSEVRPRLPTPIPGLYTDPTPALALLSSSLVVCALLPSILTVSVFVLFLTLASVRGQEEEAHA
jgi:hypothetical protein